jgi:hypothetical protein
MTATLPPKPETEPDTLTCHGCSGPIEANARIRRILTSGKGDQNTPHLCWVCTRLYHSVCRESAELAEQYKGMVD